MAASLISRCLCCVAHAFLCLLGPLLSRSKRQIKVLEDVHKRFMTCGVHACCAGVAPGSQELSPVTLASPSSLEDSKLQFVCRKKYTLLQQNSKFMQKILRGKNTGHM